MNIALNSCFTQTGIAKALDIYNFPEDWMLSPIIITRALRYLLTHHKSYSPLPGKNNIILSCINHIENFRRLGNTEVVNELVDIILEFSPERGEQFLNFQRENDIVNINVLPEEKKNLQLHPPTNGKNKTVYNDSQNVHNSTINKSVIIALENLYKMYKHIIYVEDCVDTEKFNYKINMINNIRHILISEKINFKHLINETIDYIIGSTAVFGTERLDMTDAFLSVWFWISDNDHKNELKNRLLEEFREMKGLCTTGHLARLINTIQGFTNDEKLLIKISVKDELFSVVRTYLTNALAECKDEEVILGMTDGGEKFIKFIRVSISKKILEWEKDYGSECIAEIANIVNNFSNVNIFKVK